MNERRARRPVTRRETGSRGPLTTGAFAPIIAEHFPFVTAVSSPREAGMAHPDPGCPSPAGSPADPLVQMFMNHAPGSSMNDRGRGTACCRGPAGSVGGRRTRSRRVQSRATRPRVGTARRSSVNRASWSAGSSPTRPARDATRSIAGERSRMIDASASSRPHRRRGAEHGRLVAPPSLAAAAGELRRPPDFGHGTAGR